MFSKKKGINEKKFLMEVKEFKKKIKIQELTKKIEEKQKDIHKEHNKIYEQRLDKLRHNALTNNQLSQYIADLNFRLYSLPEKEKPLQDSELYLIQLYTEIISLLEKFQTIKSEKFLTDKKELEDKIMEQSLEEQKKELSYLSRQEKYEKYIYDKLIEAQNGLIDICQKYRTQVHLCEEYEINSLKLRSELDICIDTNKKLNQIANKLRKIEKELKKKLNQIDNIKVFEPIYSSKNIEYNNDIKFQEIKSIKNDNKNYYKIDINRPKSSIKLNKNKSALILDKNSLIGNNKENKSKIKLSTNNLFKLGTIPKNFRPYSRKFIPNRITYKRTFSRKISDLGKTDKYQSLSGYTTNYLTNTRNKSMIELKEKANNNEIIYDRNYLKLISDFLTDNINKIRKEIKLKTKYTAEEIRSRYQLKYMISKIIEDIETDLENIKKEKDYDLNNYYDNLFGIQDIQEKKDMKKLENILYEKKKESSGLQLYILTFIFDNCFNGINNIKSIFPKEIKKYNTIDD